MFCIEIAAVGAKPPVRAHPAAIFVSGCLLLRLSLNRSLGLDGLYWFVFCGPVPGTGILCSKMVSLQAKNASARGFRSV